MKKAVVLLSGGLDSTTCLAVAQSEGYDCLALSFAYGQRHSAELQAAKRIARDIATLGHHVVQLDPFLFSGSALTDQTLSVPDFKESVTIPVTYVPARNTIFLAMALGLAESIGASAIFIGVSSVDYSHYPDCRPEFIAAFQKMANLATKLTEEGQQLTIYAPLQYLTKAETIALGCRLGVDYSQTVSCYQADEHGAACGRCDSCTFRKRGFAAAGLEDRTVYY